MLFEYFQVKKESMKSKFQWNCPLNIPSVLRKKSLNIDRKERRGTVWLHMLK